jgi:hypothetical protein
VGYALDAGLPTLAERLRAAGRETAGFVSAFVLDGGRVVEAAVSHVDLMPTILAAVGREVPAGVQGESLLPLVLGLDEGADRAVYSESFYPLLHYGWAPLRALRTARYKYVDAPSPELYDVAEDPAERDNLLLERRPESRRLHDRLRALTAELDADAREAPAAPVDEEALAQLQALGYMAGRGEVTAADDGERADPKDKVGLHRRIMQAQSVLGQGEDAAAGGERGVGAGAGDSGRSGFRDAMMD